MIRWCAYCQRFQGEVAPFEINDLSHGLCKDCNSIGLDWSPEQEKQIEKLRRFNERFWAAGKTGNAQSLDQLVQEALSDGIKPFDMLLGFATPALARVGKQWENGRLRIEEEQQFTKTCDAFFELISRNLQREDYKKRPQILLANVEGNQHRLGIRFVQLGLAGIGLSSVVMRSDASTNDIVTEAVAMDARVLGLSVAFLSQLPTLLATRLELSKALPSCRIVVGGWAIKSGQILRSDLPEDLFVMTPIFSLSDKLLFIDLCATK
jgi:methanogenic corrinoid protein MtbC1